MADAFVQYLDSSSAAANVVTGGAWGVSPVAGNAIIVEVSWNTAVGSVSTITDNRGNTYASLGARVQAQGKTMELWAAFNIGGSGALTLTATLSATQASSGLKAMEVSGLAGTTDGYLTFNSAGTTHPTVGPMTTTNADDFLVGFMRGGTISAYDSGWNGPVAGSLGEYQAVEATGSYTAGWTQTSSAVVAIMVAFKATAQAPPTVSVQDATVITASGATLNGSIDNTGSGGNATVEGFNWGLTTGYGNVASASGSFGAGAFSQAISGLAPSTLYHYQAFATNPGGTTLSADLTFRTNAAGVPTGEVLFNGAQLGTSGSDTSGTKANLIDANNLTNWRTSVLNTWAGVDCGTATPLTRVRLSPEAAFEDGVAGVQIQGSNDPTFATGVSTLFTVSGRAVTATLLNEYAITSSAFRYYRVTSPTAWHIADLDFIGTYAGGVTGACADPVITPPGGNFDKPTRIRISCITGNSTIYYTTDGSTPTTGSNLYTGPFVLSADTKIRAIAVGNGVSNSRVVTSYFFCPSKIYSHQSRWDNRNYNVNAAEGCFFHDPISGWWYNYLINQDCTSKSSIASHSVWQGYNVYKSADLRNWKYAGNVLGPPATQALGYTFIALRLQVLYCPATGLYVGWTSPDGTANPNGLQVWTSSSPEGPFTAVAGYTGAAPLADGFTGGVSTWYGDIGSFVDNDGKAYLIYNYNNNANTAYSQLDPANFTNTLGVGVNSAQQACVGEGQSMCRRGSTYFYIYSVFSANYVLNNYRTASTPIGPFSGATNPFVAVTGQPNVPANSGGGAPDNTVAYQSQNDQIIKIPGRDDGSGSGAYMYVGDDNFPFQTSAKFANGVYLPIVFPTASTMTITHQNGAYFDGTAYSPFSLDTAFPTVSGSPAAPSGLAVNGSVATWANNETLPHNLYLDSADDSGFTTNVASEVLPSGSTSFNISVPGSFYRVRAVNASGTTNSASAIDGGGGAPVPFSLPTLRTLLGNFAPGDTITFGGNQWRAPELISFFDRVGDPRAALKAAVSNRVISVFNGDGTLNLTFKHNK